jgi:hypothetical protein
MHLSDRGPLEEAAVETHRGWQTIDRAALPGTREQAGSSSLYCIYELQYVCNAWGYLRTNFAGLGSNFVGAGVFIIVNKMHQIKAQ